MADSFDALCLEEKIAHIVVECVAVMEDSGVCVGKLKMADILRGKTSRFVLENGYDANPAFGRLRFLRVADVRFVVDSLVEDGLLEVAFADHACALPVLKVAPRGRLELCGDNPYRARLPWKMDQRVIPAFDSALLHDLHDLRRRLAAREEIRPYHVVYDSTLFATALSLPRSLEELESISGWGPAKCEMYGEDFLAVIRSSGGRLE